MRQGQNCGPKPLVTDPEGEEKIEHTQATNLRIRGLGINVVSDMYKRTMQEETYEGDDSMIKAFVVTDNQPRRESRDEVEGIDEA